MKETEITVHLSIERWKEGARRSPRNASEMVRYKANVRYA
jgi:hypothetical protein